MSKIDYAELRDKLSENMYGVWYCELNDSTKEDIDKIVELFKEFMEEQNDD